MAWWSTPSLGAAPDLRLDGHRLSALADQHGTPLYVVSVPTVRRRIAELDAALSFGPHRIFYAMKANRHPGVLDAVVAAGAGIDACSPREVARALTHITPDRISFNAGMLSNRDLDAVVASGVHVTVDSHSALRRYGARVPSGTPVGLRLDPGVEVGYGHDPKVVYGNAKFGFPLDDLDAALSTAKAAGLRPDVLHMHCGWGLQAGDLAAFDAAMVRLGEAAGRAEVRTVNVGGGLGARQREEDAPIPLDAWADVLRRRLGGLEIWCEPGTFVVAHAGVLVCEVTQVERKAGVTWIGIDAGHNVNVYAAHYGIPMELVPLDRPLAACTQVANLAGNLNEAGDVFARGRALPHLEEGERIALLPAGAYGSSMSSDHCMRGEVREIVVE